MLLAQRVCPGKPGLACLLNGGLWESGDMGSSPGLVIFCVISGSPFPEPQSPHLYNRTTWATISQGHNAVRKHGHLGQ